MNMRQSVLGVAALLTFVAVIGVNLNEGGDSGDVVQAVTTRDRRPVVPSAGKPAERGGLLVPVYQRLQAGSAVVSEAFEQHSWYVPPPEPKQENLQPVVPPLPFVFVGKMKEGSVFTVFLERTGRTYSVKLGDIIDGLYRVDSIQPPDMTFTYMPMNASQTLAIGEAE